ncbi:MAG: hypothetical protein KDC54_14115 [Lewinella sp.]|nr:hypothetical protein [Lewinella sp.]
MPKKEISILLMIGAPALQERLQQALGERYRVSTVPGLEEGYKATLKVIPDIILIQSELPDEQAVATCRTLKNNQLSSHIPIILILEQVRPGEEAARFFANALLRSPFTERSLFRVIQQVISLKIQLMKRYPIFYKSDNPFTREQTYLSEFIELLPD